MLNIKNIFLPLLLSLAANQTMADNVFTHAIIKLPFQVRVQETWSQVITSQEQWQQFYDENKTYVSATPFPHVPPQIDFELFTVVVGGLGTKYSHTDIVVQSVSSSSSNVYLSVALLSPGSTCTVSANISYPNIAVLLPKPEGKLTIYTLEYLHECPA